MLPEKLMKMNYHTRKWIKPEDLNANHTLFGGKLLQWIDEENPKTVTKYMSEINFVNSAKQGDIIEIGIEVVNFGRTSLTLSCEVRNKMTHQTIITIDKIVFVSLDENGHPKAHGKTKIEYVEERLGKG